MAQVLRVALIGGSETSRSSRRTSLETTGTAKVIFDSDGFGIQALDVLDLNFDVAIVEQRLDNQTGFDLVRNVQALAKVSRVVPGRFLISSQFSELQLRLEAIEAGAVDCVFVSEGFDSLIHKVQACREIDPTFAIRELLPELDNLTVTKASYQSAAIALDELDVREAKILKAFCQMKTDSEISVSTSTSKVSVKTTLDKVQQVLLLSTRSQLLLKMNSLGALAL